MKLENTKLSRFLCSLGENRLHKKTIIFINEILTSGAYVSFLTTLFEAFGYKNNRQPFINLCKRFLSYKEIVCTDLEFEAIIWGESGLLPSKGLLDSSNEISSYVSCLWKYWWRIKKDIANIPEVVWSKSAIRPSNTPWRRVAGLIVLFRKIGFSPLTYLLSLFKRSLPVKEIVDELIRLFSCGDEIFGAYLNFNTKLKSVSFLIGRARAIEVIGNVIIPFFYAYSKIVKDDGLGKYMFEIWKGLPLSRSNNIALRISFERWGIPKGVVNSFSAEQGVVFIYKNLCEYFQMNCEECLIYNSLKSLNPEI